MEADLDVPLALGRVAVETEQFLPELEQTIHHVVVAVRHAHRMPLASSEPSPMK